MWAAMQAEATLSDWVVASELPEYPPPAIPVFLLEQGALL